MRINIYFLAVLLLVSCSTTVNLAVKNPTEISQIPRVVIFSDKGIEKETINLGKLEPKQETHRSMKVKHSWNVVVKSSIDKGYDAWESGQYTIPKQPDPFSIDVNLGFNGNYLPDDSRSIEQIRNALSDLGPNIGFKPIDVKNALSTWFGSLVVMIPPSKEQSEKILYQAQPSQFGKTTTYDQFIYPATSSINEVKVIGKSTANLAANMPIYGSIGVNTLANNLYNVRWSMNGFGMVIKKESGNWSYFEAIKSLSDKEKKTIQEAMEQNPSALMLYVNRLYVIKNADFFVKESKKLETGAKLSALSFVTADGAWTFDSVTESHQQYQELVLNVGGVTLSASIVKAQEAKGKIKGKKALTSGAYEGGFAGDFKNDIYQVVSKPDVVQKEYLLSGAGPSKTP
jgi:hypothetical protein